MKVLTFFGCWAALILPVVAILFGYSKPILFAVLTALLTLAMSAFLERSRLRHDRAYYFGGNEGLFTHILIFTSAIGASLFKATVAGFVALTTFSGFEAEEQKIVAYACLAICALSALFLVNLGQAAKWKRGIVRLGYFRLAIPLGLVFSSVMAFLESQSYIKPIGIAETVRTAKQLYSAEGRSAEGIASSLSKLNRLIDASVGQILEASVLEPVAPILNVVLSSNILQGFVLVPYAALIIWVGMRLDL